MAISEGESSRPDAGSATVLLGQLNMGDDALRSVTLENGAAVVDGVSVPARRVFAWESGRRFVWASPQTRMWFVAKYALPVRTGGAQGGGHMGGFAWMFAVWAMWPLGPVIAWLCVGGWLIAAALSGQPEHWGASALVGAVFGLVVPYSMPRHDLVTGTDFYHVIFVPLGVFLMLLAKGEFGGESGVIWLPLTLWGAAGMTASLALSYAIRMALAPAAFKEPLLEGPPPRPSAAPTSDDGPTA